MSVRIHGWAALAAAIALGACDDSVSSSKPQTDAACTGAFGGCGETGDATVGGTGGTGGAGGETPPGNACLNDSGCDASQYCRVPEGELEGTCTEGCRETSCGPGSVCNVTTRACECTGDEGCAADEWCNVSTHACEAGCRPDDPSTCAEGETCNEDHVCEGPPAQVVCCAAGGESCSLVDEGATCDGTLLSQLNSCDPNPCGPTCTVDGDCAADRYCGEQGICIPGCREAPNDNCPDGTFCDPAKNTCEPLPDMPCQSSDECGDGEYCDSATGECLPGCDPGECPAGEVCGADHQCTPGCNEDANCADGQYCDAELGCRDFCDGNGDCQDEEFCDLNADGGGRCVTGCRDDADDLLPGSNQDIASATSIDLENNHGEVNGRLICADNEDYYAVDLFQLARLQVLLTAVDPNAGDIQLALLDPDGNQLLQNVQPGSPKRLRYPEQAGEGVPQPATYYIVVSTQDPASQGYNLSVTLIDALGGGDNACFPDDSEFANGGRGHNTSDTADDLAWAGLRDDRYAFRGSICGSDEDWWTFASPSAEAGVSIELNVDGLTGEAVVELYNDVTVRNLGVPNFTTGAGVRGAGGTVNYRLDVPRDQTQLTQGNWYIRLRGNDNLAVLDDYGIDIQLLRPNGACGDDNEPNDAPDQVGANGNLDLLPGISMNNRVIRDQDLEVPLELRLCARDEDWFSFTASEGDQIRAWATSDNLAGRAEITITSSDGVPLGGAGAITAPGMTDAATLNGANAGTYFVRVASVAAGTAVPYTLFFHINATAMCGADVAEVGPGASRNDTSATAVLMSSANDESTRYVYDSGLICNLATPDLDWYRVNVPDPDSKLCVATEFQDVQDGDLTLEVYECDNDPVDDVPCAANRDCSNDMVRASRLCLAADNVCGCQVDADCDLDNDGLSPTDGRCVNSRCKLPLQSSSTDGAPELVDLARGTVPTGNLCILVVGATRNDQNAYALDVTLMPRAPACEADWREAGGANDQPEQANFLGSSQAGVCDAWLCNNERGTGDWYDIDVPAGEDRSILVTYAENSDGRAVFLLMTDDVNNPFHERPFDISADPREECVNVHGGDALARVHIGVQGDRETPVDGDEQIDYTLRVLPYDPATHPNGRCEEYVPNPTAVWDLDL